MHFFSGIFGALLALTFFVTLATSHSWVEQLTVISPNGTFTGAPGYARGNVLRGPGFSDPLMVNLLPPNDRPTATIEKTDLMCKDSQKAQVQTDGSPRLQAAPGSLVALRYQENGHVTLPDIPTGKPKNRGTVYIYGTTQSSDTDSFLGIHKQWNADGTGGDKRGKLIAKQDYDDGQCYQVNGGSISVARQAQFPHQADQEMGNDLWCQNDIKIPTDAPTGKPYTLYWVWDWSTLPGPNLPNGKTEIYTTCMDVDLQASDKGGSKVASITNQKDVAIQAAADNTALNNAAIPKYMQELRDESAAPVQPSSTVSSSAPSQTTGASPAESSSPPQQPVTVTVTQAPETTSVTVYLIASTPTTPVDSTTTLFVPQSTIVVPGSTISSTTLVASASSASSTASALPASEGSSEPSGSSYSRRCASCKVHKRSRLFSSNRMHHKH